ncbi:hypothetical protein LVJ94_35420 [Pendulispora rubella]|uniref:Uncharacterized protein n=1 Tax=Pendulispora rubella TaxID=2741070 RepID=A0ABZ2KU17_9BACT
MSALTPFVCRDCIAVAKDLEQRGRASEALSVLRALHVYLDYMPIFDDGSNQQAVAEDIERLSAREKEDHP